MNLRTCFTSYLTHTARASKQLFKIVFPDSDVHNYYNGIFKKGQSYKYLQGACIELSGACK